MGQKNKNKKAVVLLHGIFQPSIAMSALALALKFSGYEVFNIDYPSSKKTIEQLVDIIHGKMTKKDVASYGELNFVGFSMGGVLTREIIRKYRPENLGRVVMIGSPNNGSEVSDNIKDWLPYKALYGPAGQQLTTAFQKAAVKDLKIDYPLGIIAGDSKYGHPWFKSFMPDAGHDGLVSIESTKLDGMDDHMVVSASHTSLQLSPKVIRQVVYFLENGKFDTGNKPKAPKSGANNTPKP